MPSDALPATTKKDVDTKAVQIQSEPAAAQDRLRTQANDSFSRNRSAADNAGDRTDKAATDLARSTAKSDLSYLQSNWRKLVTDNDKLDDKQKESLKSSLDLLKGTGNTAVTDFRKVVDAISKLKDGTAADTAPRVDALTKIANTLANHPDAVHLPIDRVVKADTNLTALKQVAESFSQSARHESSPPLAVDGSLSKTGDGYEFAAGQALQRALQDKSAVDKMVAEKKLPAGDWVFVPSAKGSVADDMKFDGMLVDLKQGKAIFIDFAMHQTGRNPYQTFVGKVNDTFNDVNHTPKHPFALTLDNGTMGWDPDTGVSSGKVDSGKILERLGSYMRGAQPEALGLSGVHQAAPTQYDIANLRATLGGHFFSFDPVNGQLEADIATVDRGTTVKTRQQELADVVDATKAPRPEMRIFNLAAESAANAADDVARGTDFFNSGLRAAVETAKYGMQDMVYKPGTTVPELKFTAGADFSAKLPNGYGGHKFVGFTGDDTAGGRRDGTEIRIYENGDVLAKPSGSNFYKIGTVREMGADIARELKKNDIDPNAFKSRIKELSRIGKNFDKIGDDMKAVNDGKMNAETFWTQHPELRLLADGVQHAKASERAAKDAVPISEAQDLINKSPTLKDLADSDKKDIAKRYLELHNAGDGDLSFENVHRVIELQKTGLAAAEAIDAVRLQQTLGKEAESWSVSDLKNKYESAREAQAKDHVNVKDLAQVYRLQQVQNELKIDAPEARMVYNLKKYMPDAVNADLLKVKRMHDELKTSGVRAINLESAANIYAQHGILKPAEIAEMGKIAGGMKNISAEQVAGIAVRNLQVESLYGVDKTKADAIRSKVNDLVKSGTPPEHAHDAAALMVVKNVSQNDALNLAKTLTEVRMRSQSGTFSEMADTATLLQSVRTVGGDAIRSQFESLVLDGINKHGNDLAKIQEYLKEELFNRGAGDGADHVSWEKAYDAIDACKIKDEFAKLMGLPTEAAGQKAAIEGLEKLFKPAKTGDASTVSHSQTSISDIQTQLQGNQTFQRLTDETRMNDALKQFTDRTQNLPTDAEAQAKFLTRQLKSTMRKQLGVSTDAELPESLRNLQVKVVNSDAKAPRVVQANGAADAVIEIPAKLLAENPKGALVDAYAHASGLSMVDLLHEKGNHAVTIASLEPMLNKIAAQAEKMVGARSMVLANQSVKPIDAAAAASDRPITIDPKKPILTAWDGESLTFSGEKFHVSTEIDKLAKERSDKVKELEDQYKKAKELADSSHKAEDVASAKTLETQLANERQNLQVVSELRLALNGQQGKAAQDRARGMVKTAADRAIEERMRPREGGGAPLSRAAAITMVVTTLAFMFVASTPSQADTYSGTFTHS